MWSVPRCYKQGTSLELSQFCTGVCKDRTSAREAEQSSLLEAAARKRLVIQVVTWRYILRRTDVQTHREQGDLISLLLFLQNKKSRLKMKNRSLF
jgi:hypothetical protein